MQVSRIPVMILLLMYIKYNLIFCIGRFLASGGDDSFIAIWHLQPESKRKPDPTPPEVDADEPRSVEIWLPIRFVK